MAAVSQAQNDWVRSVFGLDMAPVDAPPSVPPSAGASARPSAKGFAERFRSFLFGDDAPKAAPADPKPPADAALAKKLAALDAAITGIEAKKFGVDRMRADLDDLKTRAAAAEAETDVKARTAAIAAVKTRADEQIRHIAALAQSIKDIIGADKAEASAEKKSKVYAKALKTLYKIDIEVPAGMQNTHFDRVFDMMGTVPQGDVTHDQLKHLVYNKANIGGVYYGGEYEDPDTKKTYKAGSIEMGDFGAATNEEDYEVDGAKVKANSFDVTTLHEIGHSVDAKHGIMDKNQSNTGCGGWVAENAADVAAAFLPELKAVALPTPVDDAKLLAAIETALGAGTVTQPADIGDEEWAVIGPWLVGHCLPPRETAQPYFNPNPVVVGSRVYTQSGSDWWSYVHASRTATFVNCYQWRTPAEWFAEVYAITWLKKKKPPSAVPAAVAKHCWQG
ncbi:MAG: hypothetical protein ABW026_14405 [Microvirga sp.]